LHPHPGFSLLAVFNWAVLGGEVGRDDLLLCLGLIHGLGSVQKLGI